MPSEPAGRNPHEVRVLILASTRADALAMARLFRANRIGFAICPTVTQLCAAQREGAGLLLLAEEAVTAETDELVSCVNSQPVWSDLPIMVLSRSVGEQVAVSPVIRHLGNVSVVERPVRTSTLLSLVRSSLRARERQYQVREHLLEQEKAQRLIRVAMESERLARSEAERASRTKDEFLATLSHELRTPLNAVLGWTHVLRRSPGLSQDAVNGLSVIERNARAQAQIIEDLLDMSSIISGKVRLNLRTVDLASVINATVESIGPTAEAKHIQLQVELDPKAEPVKGDPHRLQQVFWNLLTNAVKFTDRNGRIAVVLSRVDSNLQIEVTDNGEGIDPAFLPLVFDRFRQADPSSTRRHGGLGLGLSIVKQLVELHGGAVSATSAGKGRGATFRIILPAMAMANHAEHAPIVRQPALSTFEEPTRTENFPSAELGGVKILVVDDEADARALIERLLHDCNATVATAASAPDAIRALDEHSPDVLISDIGMPGEDGFGLIRRIRARSDELASVPAIALTAYARVEDRIKAINAGYQLHLSKPIEPAELLTMVQSLLRRPAVED
jgi:signal transduction histidine kinase/ActR/RegA family two-component response regulator